MQIIFGQEIAEEVRQRYLVLELETFNNGVTEKTAYCVVRPDDIPYDELANIETYCNLHQRVIDALKKNNVETVLDGIAQLYGHFNGELDSFYDVIKNKVS